MNTKRCDRCGAEFEEKKLVAIKIDIFGDEFRTELGHLYHWVNEYATTKRFDLCQSCLECFRSWWNGAKTRVE